MVQLKKLFLKLSAYVELFLKQDWSLLPVPDFKLVAKSDEITSHLNFMVAAVLLTATHSGKNLEYERILELVIPTALRKEIKQVQDAFLMALEPKSPTSQVLNSPRRTSLRTDVDTSLKPRVLFPSNLSTLTIERTIEEFQEFDIKLQEIDNPVDKTDAEVTETTEIYDVTATSEITEITEISDIHTSSSSIIDLQNEIKLLEIKLSEMEKLLQKSKESELSQTQTLQNLSETQGKLSEALEELGQLREKREFERIERNSLMAAFDHEKQIVEDQLEVLKKEKNENMITIESMTTENKTLKDTLSQRDELIQLAQTELDQSKLDNSKLVKALKKARDHIQKQDILIKELKETLQTSESRASEKDEELQFLKESFERERIAMNRVLVDLGSKIQKSNF